MKLLCEVNTFDGTPIKLEEQVGSDNQKHYYVSGPMLLANNKNRNGRIYPLDIMKKEVERYIKEQVETHTAYGQLNHPTKDESSIDFDHVSHLIEKVWQNGDVFCGRARLLDTPSGKICQEIIKAGGVLCSSSRALGSVRLNEQGEAIVQDDFHLITVSDFVQNPSYSDAVMESLYESADYEFDPVTHEYRKVTTESLKEQYKEQLNKKRTEIQIKQFADFMAKIRS